VFVAKPVNVPFINLVFTNFTNNDNLSRTRNFEPCTVNRRLSESSQSKDDC
jgi:hypothetical protein